MTQRKQAKVLSNSERYRKAAQTCRRSAKTSGTPVEWLRFAANWDKMAERADWLAAREAEFMMERFTASAMEAISLDRKPTIH
jgi:hypothetical protein